MLRLETYSVEKSESPFYPVLGQRPFSSFFLFPPEVFLSLCFSVSVFWQPTLSTQSLFFLFPTEVFLFLCFTISVFWQPTLSIQLKVSELLFQFLGRYYFLTPSCNKISKQKVILRVFSSILLPCIASSLLPLLSFLLLFL